MFFSAQDGRMSGIAFCRKSRLGMTPCCCCCEVDLWNVRERQAFDLVWHLTEPPDGFSGGSNLQKNCQWVTLSGQSNFFTSSSSACVMQESDGAPLLYSVRPLQRQENQTVQIFPHSNLQPSRYLLVTDRPTECELNNSGRMHSRTGLRRKAYEEHAWFPSMNNQLLTCELTCECCLNSFFLVPKGQIDQADDNLYFPLDVWIVLDPTNLQIAAEVAS